MTEEQIKFILECVNLYKKNTNCKIYTRNDIKNDKPTKPISCYVIVANYSNSNLPHVYYGGYDGNKFLSCHVSNPNIITREEYNVLGYVEYKYMTEDELIIQNAEKYACPENSNLFNIEKEQVMTHFIAGAHSREDEVNLLRDTLQSEQEQSQEHIIELQKELNKLRNPWISVKDRLPQKKDGKIRSDIVLVTIGQYWTMAEYHFGDKRWINLLGERETIEPEYWQEVNLPDEVLKKGE